MEQEHWPWCQKCVALFVACVVIGFVAIMGLYREEVDKEVWVKMANSTTDEIEVTINHGHEAVASVGSDDNLFH